MFNKIDSFHTGSFSVTIGWFTGARYQVSWYMGPENSGVFETFDEAEADTLYAARVAEAKNATPMLYNGFKNFETWYAWYSVRDEQLTISQASDLEKYAIRLFAVYGSFFDLDADACERIDWTEVYAHLL